MLVIGRCMCLLTPPVAGALRINFSPTTGLRAPLRASRAFVFLYPVALRAARAFFFFPFPFSFSFFPFFLLCKHQKNALFCRPKALSTSAQHRWTQNERETRAEQNSWAILLSQLRRIAGDASERPKRDRARPGDRKREENKKRRSENSPWTFNASSS